MDRASDAPVVASAGTQAEPRTPASWLLSAGRFQTAAPLPVGSDPRSVPRTEPVHIAPLPSSPALGRYAKGLPAAVILLRRNRTDRPLNEGFLLRRLQRYSKCAAAPISTGAPHSGITWSISANLLSCVRANLFDSSIWSCARMLTTKCEPSWKAGRLCA